MSMDPSPHKASDGELPKRKYVTPRVKEQRKKSMPMNTTTPDKREA